MNRKFAQGTEVPIERSKAEIEKVLARFGADQFMYGWKNEAAAIAFRANGRHVRFMLPMPSRKDHPSDSRFEAEKRRRWRALCLCIKAKLESVATGIETFEDSFMAHVVLPTGETMAEHARPLIAQAYDTGKMPPLLPYLQ